MYDADMRSMQLPVIACVVVAIGVTARGADEPGWDAPRFGDWRSVCRFLLRRHELPVSDQAVDALIRSSKLTLDLPGKRSEFYIFEMDYRDADHRHGIRGSNGPIYILQRSGDALVLVGGFQGSGARVVSGDGGLETHVYYHSSAKAEPPTVYPMRDGVFNTIDPTVHGADPLK